MKLQFLEAGEIVSTHGVRGEMKVLPWSDGPDFLLDFKRVRIQGVDTMEAAQALRGKVLQLYREDIDDEVIFAAELIGMEVCCDGNTVGKITEVLDYPGNKVYVVKGEKEYMIPAVKEFILDTDMEANRMQVKLLEGMATDAD